MSSNSISDVENFSLELLKHSKDGLKEFYRVNSNGSILLNKDGRELCYGILKKNLKWGKKGKGKFLTSGEIRDIIYSKIFIHIPNYVIGMFLHKHKYYRSHKWIDRSNVDSEHNDFLSKKVNAYYVEFK